MYNETLKKAQLKYQKESVQQVKFTLNKNTEVDIIEWLNSQENKQGYIKSLILADMQAHKHQGNMTQE